MEIRISVRVAVAVVLIAVAMVGCNIQPETREYRENARFVDACERESREPTGDLAQDIVGGWFQDGPWSFHPVGGLGSGGRAVLLFRPDGTGHVWWALNATTGSDGGDSDFEWTVDDGYLVVNDLPPAEAEVRDTSIILRHPDAPNPDTEIVFWYRCDPDIPDDT